MSKTNGQPKAPDRLPPHSIEAEQSVLGCILLDPGAGMDYCVNLFKAGPVVFYDKRHQALYECLLDMHEASDLIDCVTLCTMLQARCQLDDIGGLPYLMSLPDNVPSAANLEYYAQLVFDKFALRRLIQVCTGLITGVYRFECSVADYMDDAEKQIMAINSERVSSDIEPMKTLTHRAITTIERYAENKGIIDGLSTGFADFDNMTGGLKPGEMIVIAARPSIGKTSIALNIAEHVAVEHKLPVGVFSLEMSRDSLVIRTICSRARVNLRNIREGFLAERDIPRLTTAAGRLASAELYIDDSSGLSITQLRARARRMVSLYHVKLIVVDYLQLLHSTNRRAQNRQQEVADISKGIKNLAKDLALPVIVLSQLNRLADREERRPRLSDLRECLCADSTLLYTPFGPQLNAKSENLVYAKGDGIQVADSSPIPKAAGPVIRIVLTSGRELVCTANHLIQTDVGWVPAGELTPAQSVACCRSIPQLRGRKISEARWIGWMLGNGSMLRHRSASFVCSDVCVALAFIEFTEAFFKIGLRFKDHWCGKVFQYELTNGHCGPNGNPVLNWLRANDLFGKRSWEKMIPQWFLESADNASIGELIGGLIDTDGSVTRGHIKFTSTSKQLCLQLLWCFARLGIFVRMDHGYVSKKAKRPIYTLMIQEGREVERFRSLVALIGRKGQILTGLRCSAHGSNYGDRLGTWVSDVIAQIAKANKLSWRDLGYRAQGKRISQRDLQRVLVRLEHIGVLDPRCAQLRTLIQPDIFWDQFKRKTDAGIAQLFDRAVPGLHNFVANGIVVHNSGDIEQDADVVGLMFNPPDKDGDPPHRDQDYCRVTLDIAKQRSGPTGDVHLVFLKTYTKFESAAKVEEEPPDDRQQELPAYHGHNDP